MAKQTTAPRHMVPLTLSVAPMHKEVFALFKAALMQVKVLPVPATSDYGL